MEMCKLFSNTGAEINKREMLVCWLYIFIGFVYTIIYEPIYSLHCMLILTARRPTCVHVLLLSGYCLIDFFPQL